MLQAFVITLREGLEAFLIVAISLAYLRKTGRQQLIPAVHWGIALSILVSIGAAVLFTVLRFSAIAPDWSRAEVWVKSTKTGDRKRLLENAVDARYGGGPIARSLLSAFRS